MGGQINNMAGGGLIVNTDKFSVALADGNTVAGTLAVTGATIITGATTIANDGAVTVFNNAGYHASNQPNGIFKLDASNGAMDLDINGDKLAVHGTTTFSNQAIFAGGMTATGEFAVSSGGEMDITGAMTVTGATLNGAVTLKNLLDVVDDNGDSTNKFTVTANTGNTAINADLNNWGALTGTTLAADAIGIGGSNFQVANNGDVQVAGVITLDGAPTWTGGDPVISGGVSTTTDGSTKTFEVAAAGDTSITGSLTVTAGATLTGVTSLAAGGSLTVKDSAEVTTNPVDIFTVSGSSGDTNFKGITTVKGDFAVNTNKFTVAASTGNTEVKGTLGVGGAITAKAAATLGSLVVKGDLAVMTNKFTVTAADGNTLVTTPTATYCASSGYGSCKSGLSVKGTSTFKIPSSGASNKYAMRLTGSKTPVTSGTACTTGQLAWDANKLYLCVDSSLGPTLRWRQFTLAAHSAR